MVVSRTLHCLDCGTQLSEEPWAAGLCPHCLVELALAESSTQAAELDELETEATLAYPSATSKTKLPFEKLSAQQILGERYQVRSLLGRGGMGEVWRAYDLKLRQDVALKSLRTELLEESRALETLRQEVRVAREVISPNVCRVYDLEELDGRELVSMEYVDGTTLQEILLTRGPLELDEARELASQFLAGLEAIHAAGLVHRDIKPENIMITRTGRVVVMDFGIAKGLGETKGGMVAGTPAYMSPEQARGGELDARGDLFSAGVVLAEMVEPGGVRTFDERRRLWEGLHEEPPRIPETPWSKVIAKAVAQNPEERFAGASALARALEEVTLRAAGDEEARPYPGLAAFQEEDARFFFGRELEVEALWKKLRQPHLLAVIGPSGAGKSSFLRAGLLPTLTDGWQALVATPGSRPFANLARQLAPELSDEPRIVDRLLRFEEPEVAIELFAEWRRQGKHALVIVDQFEELFTQNPEEVQASFAELLAQLPLKADLHVLLSMRDDFLYHCHRFESFRPILTDLTLLGPPTGASLRRAIIEPALRCGYRFEEESMVEEMLAEVEGERGALPMVAFTAARLWEERDRETGLLTKEAYGRIGGVGGALAQHAEKTLERIGEDSLPIVRELFRNLVTAQGTRAARDREELLSVFGSTTAGTEAGRFDGGVAVVDSAMKRPGSVPAGVGGEREAAEHVLDALIDARLVTSYEVPADEDGGSPSQRIEIVHESLLTAWPRLVRWRTQDEEGAQLRDELRNQALLWQQHDRSPDYLWTGAAYLDYLAWSERYPGGLSAAEEEFTRAMTAHAERRRRRRRIAIVAAFGIVLVILGVVGYLGWRAELERRRAEAQALRAEAAKLLAIAQLQLETDPTEALAYTTTSLELADTADARLFALRFLSEAPPTLGLDLVGTHHGQMDFSPDQRRLAVAGASEKVEVYAAEGGPPVILLGQGKGTEIGGNRARWFSNEILVTGHPSAGLAGVWSFPPGELVREIEVGGTGYFPMPGKNRFFVEVMEIDADSGHELYRLRAFQLPKGELEELGVIDLTSLEHGFSHWSFVDRDGRAWIYPRDNEILYRPLPVQEGVPDRFLGRHENLVLYGSLPSPQNRFWTRDAHTSELQLWDFSSSTGQPAKVVRPPAGLEEGLAWVPVGFSERWVRATDSRDTRSVRLWDLDGWLEARPLELRRSGNWLDANATLAPREDWLVAVFRNRTHLAFWPMNRTWPRVVDGYESYSRFLTFSPDGLWLATNWEDGNRLRLWPLPGNPSREVRSLTLPEEDLWMNCAFDPRGRYLFVVGGQDRPYVVPLDGSPPRRLDRFSDSTLMIAAAVSPSGDQVATAFGQFEGPKTLRIWNLESGELRLYDLPESATPDTNVGVDKVSDLAFADETALYTGGDGGVRRWDLESGTHELVLATRPGYGARMRLAADGRTALVSKEALAGDELGSLRLLDLATGEERPLPEFGETPRNIARPFDIDGSGSVVASGDADGLIRVGRVGGGEPHLLVGHQGPVGVAISPDGRWVASAGEDHTLRLWPMPDLDQPPLHTLPHDELMAELRSLTNIRVVRDPESAQGWKVTLDPFPGWAEVPTW